MQSRKTAYEHEVEGHFRKGVWVDKYTRGKGKKPVKSSRRSTSLSKGGKFKGTLYYPGGSETYRVNARTLSEMIKQLLSKLQRPVVPNKIGWVRV